MDEDLLARLNDSQTSDRVLEDFNSATLDEVEPLGCDQGMAVLSEMNSLADDHDQFVKSLAPKADTL